MLNVKCITCDKSFDSDIEFITHEIEIHPISSWSEEVDIEQGKEISCTDEQLENEVLADLDREIELEPKVKFILDKNRIKKAGLLQDMKDIEWGGWQRDLRQWAFVEGINKEPNQNTLSRDRGTILKISNDLTELSDVAGSQKSYQNLCKALI